MDTQVLLNAPGLTVIDNNITPSLNSKSRHNAGVQWGFSLMAAVSPPNSSYRCFCWYVLSFIHTLVTPEGGPAVGIVKVQKCETFTTWLYFDLSLYKNIRSTSYFKINNFLESMFLYYCNARSFGTYGYKDLANWSLFLAASISNLLHSQVCFLLLRLTPANRTSLARLIHLP